MRRADPALLPAATAGAVVPSGGGRSRHELPREVAARIAEGVPANTRRAWESRYARYHAWALSEGYEAPMPPTDPMLAAYLDYLGYDQHLKVSTLTAHLGSLMALTGTFVADVCAQRAVPREQRARARAAELDRLDAEQRADAGLPPDDPDAAERRERRAARRAELDTEELADLREAASDPQVPDTVLAQRALKAYARRLARTGKGVVRKATVLTPKQLRTIAAKIDTVDAAGKRDKALLLIWFAAGRRSDETSSLYLSDIRFARPHGVRLDIRRSKTDPHGLAEDTVSVPYLPDAVDWPFCPVRALEAWLDYLAKPVDPEHSEDGPRYAPLGAFVPLWPRIDRRGALGTQAWSAARGRPDDDGGLSTQALRDILRRRAADADIQVDGTRETEFGGEERVQISTHTMRRSFITAAAEAGKDINDVALHVGMKPGSRTLYEYWELSSRGWDHNAAADILKPPPDQAPRP